jgi:ketosteroid isomerase-like protein
MRWAMMLAIGSICLTLTQADGSPAGDDAWGSLVAAERAFSADSEARGLRAAFLAYFEPGVLTFPAGKPLQVGTRHLQDGPDQPGVLSWRPIKAEVSSSGDFGYTTGPYEFRRKKEDPSPVATGSYASVWRRRTYGAWRVLADFGYSGPHPADANVEPVRPQPRRPVKKPGPTTGDILVAEDHKFEKACASDIAKGYEKYMAEDVRFYRDGQAPSLCRKDAVKAVAARASKVLWFPERARVADGGDLGYTVGTMTVHRKQPAGVEPDHMKYMRIWRNERGKWKVVLEVANAAPAPEE